ncbi:MAG: flagellar filament capping protein FliD [Gammaproteobacteria bacterium]|jgi:flagellar hook-associated protein 2|nr:flagellar filament capping protein FliD [Gammaproteobacteria bacterium]MBU0773487.1 flagellar filament capping protein FliD [Gammaproteobacteria bacterium]MBU0856697.1 flagellar filament capping protein FliD [Gammaproteobacteria bacterium]MBU1846773.1 flagellar filament capping protein FliD [Gammaproteobacteria bacterium]
MSTFDPVTTASQLATAYVQAAQTQTDTQNTKAQATSAALTKLQSALQAFDSALSSLSLKKGLTQNAATLSGSGMGTVTASSSAVAGEYPLFVEQIASAHQVVFTDLPAVPVPMGGMLGISLAGGATIGVDFSNADMDADGTLSQSEMARAINQAAGNEGKVTAMVITAGGQTQLVLSSAETGADGQITLDTSDLPAGAFKASLDAGAELTPARDAIVWLGAQGSGVRLQQASNTFTAIEGVSMTFTRAMTTGEAPITLKVASDDGGTAANVKSFVDAFNTLRKSLNDLTSSGDASSGVAAAAFASDSGIRALRNRMDSIVRQDIGGVRLMDFGVSADRSGTLSLDTTKLEKAMTANPDGLDELFGSASLTASSGLLGSFSSYVDVWLDSAGGQIQRRKDSIQTMQKSLTARQSRIDLQYDNAYQRYLVQFTQLQAMQSQMGQTTSMFDALFSSSSAS